MTLLRRRVSHLVGATALAAAATVGTMATTASAASAEPTSSPVSASDTRDYVRVPSKVFWLYANDARLRSGPTTAVNNVIDSANAGNGFTSTCWTQDNFGSVGYVWHYGTLWGGGTGYMRADMLTNPNTGTGTKRC